MGRRMKKKPQVLPEELLIEILLRVPAKSLERLKRVSRQWFSLISDPHFAKSHFDLALARTQKVLLLGIKALKVEALSIDVNTWWLRGNSSSRGLKLKFPIRQPCFGSVTIIDSCRGFILLDCLSSLYIWNPCTGFHKQIPSPPNYHLSFLVGFGYDHSTDDYLVILATTLASGHEKTSVGVSCPGMRVEVFSYRANTWQELEGTGLCRIKACVHFTFSAGLYFNGAIHWYARDYSRHVDSIVVFDLTKRAFSWIALPNVFYPRNCVLRELGGFLCVCVMGCQRVGSEIWVMKEDEVQLSWTSCFIVVPPHDDRSLFFTPICFTKDGFTVGVDGHKDLVKFNEKGDVLEHCRNFKRNRRSHACYRNLKDIGVVMYTESLLSLPCDSYQAEETKTIRL